MALVFGLQTLLSIDFSKIYQSKGLKPKNKGYANFYKCCDLTEKVYLYDIVPIFCPDVFHKMASTGSKRL